MKHLLLATLIAAAPAAHAAEDRADNPSILSFNCKCVSTVCTLSGETSVKYNPETLLLEVSNEKWSYKAYVTREESKVAGIVSLTLPRSYVFTGGTLRFKDGKMESTGGETSGLSCERTN